MVPYYFTHFIVSIKLFFCINKLKTNLIINRKARIENYTNK